MHHVKFHRIRIRSLSCLTSTTGCLKPKSTITTHTTSSYRNQLEFFLQTCSSDNLLQGKQVHSQSIVNGITNHGLLGGRILGMYVLCNSFSDAKKLFYRLEKFCYTMPWNWMIRGLIQMGCFDFALLFYLKMLGSGVFPDKYTFPPVIKACGGLKNVRLGRMVHDAMLEMGFDVDAFVGSSLIKLYAENGFVDYARGLFDKMPHKDCVLWNVMLNGLVVSGEMHSALKVFEDMRRCGTKPDSATFSCILSVCASEAMFEYGTQFHGLVVTCGLEFDLPVANTLMSMYSKCGHLSDAHKLFKMMPQTNLVTWNGIISGHVQNGLMDEALPLFREMISAGVKPDSVTFTSFLPSLAESASLRQGKEIHGYIIRHGMILDLFLDSALIDIYFKHKDVEMARKIFYQTTAVDIVACTSMISGYVLNGLNDDALGTFRWLLEENMCPNAVTMTSILPACAGMAALKLGKELHGNILKNRLDRNCLVESALMDMYAKCGRLDLARKIFRGMSEKDTVSWNSIITSHSQNGKPKEAIDLFRQMGIEGIEYDCVSISVGLSACANLPALNHGKEIHGFMIKTASNSDIFSESALIDMYAKCGNLEAAHRVFNMMQEKNEVSWNSIISAYGNHGLLEDTLVLFHKMLENGFHPDHLTFLAIMSACGHAGQIDNGIRYFCSMTEEYGIPARMEHYSCMVDLFGRAGHLNEAFETIKSMPFAPDAGIWGTLLGACRVHGNVDLAEVASKYLLDLDPKNSGYYILLSNLQANTGQWRAASKIRISMKERGVQKVPGYSWIEVNNTTHIFVSADRSHPHSAHIYSSLKSLLPELRREGYVPQHYLPTH